MLFFISEIKKYLDLNNILKGKGAFLFLKKKRRAATIVNLLGGIFLKKLTVGSFFAGVGGIDLGFENTNQFKVVYANEFDKYPAITYETNFDLKVDVRDINNVKASEIPDFDVITGGFPCQAFSLAGYQQGFNDEKGRGTLFFEMLRIIKEKKSQNKQPRIVFLENVKNLVGHDNGRTFQVILDSLKHLNYKVQAQVMNAYIYGNIPQNRERIYIVGFLDEKAYNNFHFPLPIELTNKLEDVIEFDKKQDDKYYYSNSSCKFYPLLDEEMTKTDTIYQWRRVYVRENKSNVCPTLTANMGTGGHNVPLIRCKSGIRKLTPRECFNLQGFPSNFILPKTLSNTRLYKQAGNSVVVPLIERIAQNICKAIS
ncbi:DNA cytosine methyltransferase [Megamonas hypermegale]|nr:DNA cytosine methyltransferase [Megamonas hypermegale]